MSTASPPTKTQPTERRARKFVWPLSLHAWDTVDDAWAPPSRQAEALSKQREAVATQKHRRFVWPLSLRAWSAVDGCWTPTSTNDEMSAMPKLKLWDLAAFDNLMSNRITMKPFGFDLEDGKMADKNANPEDVTKYLAPQAGNPAVFFRIGVAFVGGAADGSMRLGHAEVVVQEYKPDPKSAEEPDSSTPLHAVRQPEVQKDGSLHLNNGFLIHLYFKQPDMNMLTLAFEEWSGSLRYYRYVEMLRVYTTKRTLKHFALKSCPEEHSVVVSNCASVARQFISGLLDHLRDPQAPSKELEKQKELLLKYIHIEDGWVGESEDMSRTELDFSAKSWGVRR